MNNPIDITLLSDRYEQRAGQLAQNIANNKRKWGKNKEKGKLHPKNF
jgi:hypothetical protein